MPGDRACVSDRAVLLAPDIVSPRQDHRQGRAQGASLPRWRSATLDGDLPRQDLGTSQEDGGMRSECPLSSHRSFCGEKHSQTWTYWYRSSCKEIRF